MPQVTEPHIIAIAKASAFVERANHSYLPQTLEEREAFVPHNWVLLAVRQAWATAYAQGREDQRVDTQRQTQ